MCQTCVDEGYLSQETFDKIEAFLTTWPGAEFGPAHVVLGDDNVEDHFIEYCLGYARAALYHDASIDLANSVKFQKEMMFLGLWTMPIVCSMKCTPMQMMSEFGSGNEDTAGPCVLFMVTRDIVRQLVSSFSHRRWLDPWLGSFLEIKRRNGRTSGRNIFSSLVVLRMR